jgi:smad nuclear-interacting protein 1
MEFSSGVRPTSGLLLFSCNDDMPSSGRYRSRSPVERERRERARSRDAPLSRDATRRERSRSPVRRRRSRSRSPAPEGSRTVSKPEYGKPGSKAAEPEEDNAKPNFGLSGKLAAETNTFRGVVLKYNEPPEARKPTKSWRLYIFKGKEQLGMFCRFCCGRAHVSTEMHHISKQSCYLIGRDRLVSAVFVGDGADGAPQVCDLPIDHPSASKQHAVIQFRQMPERNEFGDVKMLVKCAFFPRLFVSD